MNRQQICEKFITTNSKKGFTQCYRLLERANCLHLKCFRGMKKVLKDKWCASARTEEVHISEGRNIDPGHGTLVTEGH